MPLAFHTTISPPAATIETRLSLQRGAHTPVYSSPQQRRGAAADLRDDVHALGVIWYQILLGDPAAERPGGMAWQRRFEQAGMPRPWIDLLIACIEEDPADRPANAAVLAERLGALLQEVLDFPRVLSQGRTLNSARRMIRDALRSMAEWLTEDR